MAVVADISISWEAMGAPVKVATVKFIDGIGFLVKTIYENHFSMCQDLYVASISDMAD